ncbi:hypothetical protein [Glaciecola petra]|uniref:Twin-arginine translocation pathway signal n=1 Tax=Glaciecola petra TaxID=3075602 RepID=A0ABU2ZMP7_9ALTE|nr:hypothetical protein [Aestuariibacter sp. P117]MDT0593318.1 hypothetical protein [Aestuariibacter sp. P117]
MTIKKRFVNRKAALKGLAIAAVTATTIPIANSEEVNEQSAKSISNSQASPTIKSITRKNVEAEKNHIQMHGSDFNAGKSTNNGEGSREKSKPIILAPKS